MRKLLIFGAVLFGNKSFAQCGNPIVSGSGQNCLGTTLTVSAATGDQYSKIIWYNDFNDTAVKTATPTAAGTIDLSFTPTVPGTYSPLIIVDSCSIVCRGITINPIVTPSVAIFASSTSVTNCTPVTFMATITNTNTGSLLTYEWQVNGVNVGPDAPTFSVFLDSNSIVRCMTTSNAVCITDSIAVSPPLSIAVTKMKPPSIAITASPDTSCSGTPVQFSAMVGNPAADMVYAWRVDGAEVGSNSPVYSSSSLSNQDTVSCKISIDSNCLSGVSNGIVVTVFPSPTIPPGQVFTLKQGQSVLLTPVVNGGISSYLWRPGTGLSDDTIKNPIAAVPENSTYELDVQSVNGCKGSGEIMVQVDGDIRIPNAFTPNGDGKNDVFFVLTGPLGCRIDEFTIFNRWGQAVHQGQNLVPGDPTVGWDGTFKGGPAAWGTYVYVIKISFANGKKSVYRGTVELIR